MFHRSLFNHTYFADAYTEASASSTDMVHKKRKMTI